LRPGRAAALLSPFLKPGTVSTTFFFNRYSLLKTVEDVFDIDQYPGYAGQQGLLGFFGCASSDISLQGHEDMAHEDMGSDAHLSSRCASR
jgi:hypothetical protein